MADFAGRNTRAVSGAGIRRRQAPEPEAWRAKLNQGQSVLLSSRNSRSGAGSRRSMPTPWKIDIDEPPAERETAHRPHGATGLAEIREDDDRAVESVAARGTRFRDDHRESRGLRRRGARYGILHGQAAVRGRSHHGKMPTIGIIELGDGNAPGRLRLAEETMLRINADPAQRVIVCRLGFQRFSIGAIARATGLSKSRLMEAARGLMSMGLVSVADVGGEHILLEPASEGAGEKFRGWAYRWCADGAQCETAR